MKQTVRNMNREFDKLLKVALSEAMDEEYRWTRAAQEQAPGAQIFREV